jgi:hypothetical protein
MRADLAFFRQLPRPSRSLTNATTGSERVVPEEQQPSGQGSPLPARLARSAASHWPFGIVLLAAVVVRVVVILGYPPILWFSDSYSYIQDAIAHVPDKIRQNGYPFLLDLLEPLHSWYPVALLQAAMGVGMGVAIYALLRHRGLPWWGAILPTLPVLFDSYELHLEHMVSSDPLFIFLVTIAVVMLCWSDRPSVAVAAVAGLLIGYATTVRSVGEPVIVVVLVGMLARRMGWRRLLAVAVAWLIPAAAYMALFHHFHGQYNWSESDGPFLYSRVSAFAECSKMNVPADASWAFLCDPVPPQDRPPPGQYIWANNDFRVNGQVTYTPLYTNLGPDTSARFTPAMNALTMKFAERAIEEQPLAYLRVVTKDVLHTFGWNRQPDPNDWYGNGPVFQFVTGPELTAQVPSYATPAGCDAQCQTGPKGDVEAHEVQTAERDFADSGLGFTQAVKPWERLLEVYQRYVYLRGTLLGIIVLIGAAGIVLRWHRRGGLVLLPWLVGALLIVIPPVTAGFSYRYVLAAVPVICLAAGLAFAAQPGEKSVRSLTADLRRHLGRRVGVEQE